MTRRTLALPLLALWLVWAPPALAHGPLRHGVVIVKNNTFIDATGNCTCDIKWYTVGLNPGLFTASARLVTYGRSMGPSYGLRMYLDSPSGPLTWGQTACLSTKHLCNQRVTLRYRIKHHGVYYLHVQGPGAEGVEYVLRVTGSIYPLRCTQYC